MGYPRPLKIVYQAYQNWGGSWSKRRFSNAMGEHGYKTEGRDNQGRALYRGLGLVNPQKQFNKQD